MKVRLISLLVLLVACGLRMCRATDSSKPVMFKAGQLFGDPLNAEHRVFGLNDTYVIWLILDTEGNLTEVDVGPRSYYTTEFPSARKPVVPERLSSVEYGDA